MSILYKIQLEECTDETFHWYSKGFEKSQNLGYTITFPLCIPRYKLYSKVVYVFVWGREYRGDICYTLFPEQKRKELWNVIYLLVSTEVVITIDYSIVHNSYFANTMGSTQLG